MPMLCQLIFLVVATELSICFFIHFLAPPFLSLVVVLCDVVADTVGLPNKLSIKTPIAIPTAVNMDTIVTPCFLKRVLILSPSVPVSLSENLVIDSLIC